MTKKIIVVLFIVGIVITQLGYSQPITPKEKITANLPKNIRAQLEKLYSADPVTRGHAVINLGDSRSIDAIPFLIEMFTDHASLQQSSGSILTFTSPASLASDALAKIGTPAVKPLIEALTDR